MSRLVGRGTELRAFTGARHGVVDFTPAGKETGDFCLLFPFNPLIHFLRFPGKPGSNVM